MALGLQKTDHHGRKCSLGPCNLRISILWQEAGLDAVPLVLLETLSIGVITSAAQGCEVHIRDRPTTYFVLESRRPKFAQTWTLDGATPTRFSRTLFTMDAPDAQRSRASEPNGAGAAEGKPEGEKETLARLQKETRALEAATDRYRQLELELAAHEEACKKDFKRIEGELKGSRDPAALELKGRLAHLRTALPQPPALLLRLALGAPTPSHIRTQAARLAYKSSHETFKLRATIFSSLFALLNILLPLRILDGLFMLCLLSYYSTLTLREHVLAANGSRIRSWWLFHHTLTVVMTCVLLLWPPSPSYSRFRPYFYSYAMYLSVVQYAQYKYQSARLYALRSLGETNSMETAGGEGVTVVSGREVQWLVPYLIGGWIWQGVCAYLGAYLWWTGGGDEMPGGGLTASGPHGPWQALGVGINFLVLGFGNAWMTYVTFREKAAKDRWVFPPRSSLADQLTPLPSFRSRGRPPAPGPSIRSSSGGRSTSRGSIPRSSSRGAFPGSDLGLPPPLDLERRTPPPRPPQPFEKLDDKKEA